MQQKKKPPAISSQGTNITRNSTPPLHEGRPAAFWEAIILTMWGFEVLPLDGKKPHGGLGKNESGKAGFYRATTDRDQLDRWWARWPRANVGARPPHWAVVLDVDVKGGGLDTWAALNNGHELPTTLVTRSGSGGYHYWFRLPYKAPLNGQAGAGVDVRDHFACVAMPGSIHPTTGDYYSVETWCPPQEWPVLPGHLHKYVFNFAKIERQQRREQRHRPPNQFCRPRPGAAWLTQKAADLIEAMATAVETTRNDTLNKAAFEAAALGLDIQEELYDAAIHAGLAPHEVESTLRSGTAAGEIQREVSA